jgi:predicted nucleotidyltransferase
MNDDKDIKRIVHYFKGQDEVSALYIFGGYAKGRKTGESDIDVGILVDESRLKRRNFEFFKKKYYAASPAFSMRLVDIVILNTAPPFLKHQVLKTGRVLFDRNRKLRVSFTTNAITEYLDYKPIQDTYLKALAKRIRRTTVGR